MSASDVPIPNEELASAVAPPLGAESPPTVLDASPVSDIREETPEESLERLRHDVHRRLEAVIVGEKELRQRVRDVQKRLTPELKKLDELKQALRLDRPPLATLRARAAESVQQQAAEIATLSTGLSEAAQLRTDLSEAGLRRFQQLQKVTLEPVLDWSRHFERCQTANTEATAELAERTTVREKRWLPEGNRPEPSPSPIADAPEAA